MTGMRALVMVTVMLMLVPMAGWAGTNAMCGFQLGNERCFIQADSLNFEIQDSGKVQLSAFIRRISTQEGKGEIERLERIRFSFALPLLPKIVGKGPAQDAFFFPAYATTAPLYRELLKVCVAEQLFPSAVVQRSSFLR